MKTIIIATLKSGWHDSFKNLTEKAHEILDDVSRIYFYGAEDVDDAKATLEAEGYYSFLPPRWDNDFSVSDNMKALQNFCGLIKDLQIRAFPLTVDESDIEEFVSIDVTDSFYETLKKTDFEDLKINDLDTIDTFTNMVF